MAHLRGGPLLLMTLMIMVLMTTFTPKLLNRFGIKRILVAGLGLMALGISITPSHDEGCYAVSEIVTTKIFIAYVLPASLISALAMSLAYIPIMTTAIPSARTEQIVLASGLGSNYSYRKS
jgi:MFS family permease